MITYKAFVSSTYEDLKDHRRHVIAELRSGGIHVDPMEEWTAGSSAPKELSKKACRRLQSVRTACSTQAGSYPSRSRREHHADGVPPSCGIGNRCSPFLAG